jgi:hypothetical protein
MTDHKPRLFACDADIRDVGARFLDCTLPKAEWTHEAHLATCLWIVTERPDIDPETDLGSLIRRYNLAMGGVNDDTQGYHDTMTRCFIHTVRRHLAETCDDTLVGRVNALLQSPYGRRDWPLQHYTRETLFSVAARRGFLKPDLKPFA